MARPFVNEKIDKVVVLDARGFLLGTPIAYNIGAGVCLVRKKGKLPFKTIEATYQKEYGSDTVAMHEDTIKRGERVLIVDDLLATGGTMGAAVELVEKLEGDIVGISLIVDLPFLGGSAKFGKYNLKWLVSYNAE
jgi:adenine phosphoribosyltransferase